MSKARAAAMAKVLHSDAGIAKMPEKMAPPPLTLTATEESIAKAIAENELAGLADDSLLAGVSKGLGKVLASVSQGYASLTSRTFGSARQRDGSDDDSDWTDTDTTGTDTGADGSDTDGSVREDSRWRRQERLQRCARLPVPPGDETNVNSDVTTDCLPTRPPYRPVEACRCRRGRPRTLRR